MKKPCQDVVVGSDGEGRPCGREKAPRSSTLCHWHRLARMRIVDQVAAADARLEAVSDEIYRARVPEAEWPSGDRWCAGCQSFVPTWYCAGSRCRACASRAKHEYRTRTTYGIDADTYNALFKLQDGRCAICRHRQNDRRLAVDHHHGTGAVRGLLCSDCNHKVLGGAHDSILILTNAIYYLTQPPASGRWVPPEEEVQS